MKAAAILGALLALTIAGSAGARTDANGIPAYVDGYAKWPKLNAKPIRGGSPAHQGTKQVYASKRKTGAKYPIGAIVVKTATPPGQQWLSLVATMRKIRGSANGGWRWEEFTRTSRTARFTKVPFPESGCAGCHMQAKANDYVFTRR
ncbi:MAG: cytochrome P460 family protein [Gaiellaceae bacterium MAG52_C11]|nr:cytochrome P460 family protein [Candidatus Gaiellasilicea maunaloa]